MAISYAQIIDEVIKLNNLNYETVLLEQGEEIVTIGDFVKTTKKMSSWHERLGDALCDIQAENGDIPKYLKKFVEEKTKNGFSFK